MDTPCALNVPISFITVKQMNDATHLKSYYIQYYWDSISEAFSIHPFGTYRMCKFSLCFQIFLYVFLLNSHLLLSLSKLFLELFMKTRFKFILYICLTDKVKFRFCIKHHLFFVAIATFYTQQKSSILQHTNQFVLRRLLFLLRSLCSRALPTYWLPCIHPLMLSG